MRLRRWLKEVEKAAGRKREVEPPLKAFRKKDIESLGLFGVFRRRKTHLFGVFRPLKSGQAF